VKYNVWLLREDGSKSPAGPSVIWAPGLVEAQKRAAEILADCQSNGALLGWSIHTVTERPEPLLPGEDQLPSYRRPGRVRCDLPRF